MKKKPVIAMDLSSTGKGGGPFVSTSRIMNSGLSDKYNFQIIHYRTELGRGICLKRIIDISTQIKEIKPDIVHFTGLQLSGFHIAAACKLAGFKNTIITIRGFSGDTIYFNPLKKLITKFIIEPITLLLVKKIYGNSEFTVNRKLVLFFKKKTVGAIYNFPPLPLNSKPTIRQELGICKSDIVIVSVARITKDKGYNILDEAILRFSSRTDIKFIIVGDGDYLLEMKSKIKQQIENQQVFFLGYRNDIQSILNGCDIFVLPTLHETLSSALLEASVEGIALVASNVGGVPEIVENGINGYLVEPGNVLQLVQSMEDLSNDHEKRKMFGANAKNKIQNKFSILCIENKINRIYESMLK